MSDKGLVDHNSEDAFWQRVEKHNRVAAMLCDLQEQVAELTRQRDDARRIAIEAGAFL